MDELLHLKENHGCDYLSPLQSQLLSDNKRGLQSNMKLAKLQLA